MTPQELIEALQAISEELPEAPEELEIILACDYGEQLRTSIHVSIRPSSISQTHWAPSPNNHKPLDNPTDLPIIILG